MARTNRFLLASLFGALAISAIIIFGVHLDKAVADELSWHNSLFQIPQAKTR